MNCVFPARIAAHSHLLVGIIGEREEENEALSLSLSPLAIRDDVGGGGRSRARRVAYKGARNFIPKNCSSRHAATARASHRRGGRLLPASAFAM